MLRPLLLLLPPPPTLTLPAAPRQVRSRFMLLPGYEEGGATGPQHGALGDHALAMYRLALAEFERAGTTATDEEYAITLGNIAFVHMTRGEYTEALPWQKRSLVFIERVMGGAHPASRRTRREYAMALMELGRRPEGLQVLGGARVALSAADAEETSTLGGCGLW